MQLNYILKYIKNYSVRIAPSGLCSELYDQPLQYVETNKVQEMLFNKTILFTHF